MFFDILAHPTVDGGWLNGAAGQSFEQSKQSAREAGLVGACAVGLPGVGAYEHEVFFRQSVNSGFVPVAGVTARTKEDLLPDLHRIRDIGYRVVKIHPRLLGYHDKPGLLRDSLAAAHDLDLKVMLCTYTADRAGVLPGFDLYDILVASLNSTPELSLMLVHGGVNELLKYSLLARHTPNVYLDLSFTFMRYRQSSVGLDAQFVLEQLDQKTCLGSDHPEYSFADVMPVVEELTGSLSPAKMENVRHRTALRFLDL